MGTRLVTMYTCCRNQIFEADGYVQSARDTLGWEPMPEARALKLNIGKCIGISYLEYRVQITSADKSGQRLVLAKQLWVWFGGEKIIIRKTDLLGVIRDYEWRAIIGR